MGIDEQAEGGSGKDRYPGLASLLRGRREALGISRRDLAETTGLSYPYIAQLEGGYRAPSVSSARRLADALRLPVEDIVRAAGEPPTATAPAPRDRPWLANPAYAPGIGVGRADAPSPSPSPPAAAPIPPALSPIPLAAAPIPVGPGAASPVPLAAGRGGPFRRRRSGRPSGASTPSGPPVVEGGAPDTAAEAAEAIAGLLRALPPGLRLDALAAAQREVLAGIVEDRISVERPPTEPR